MTEQHVPDSIRELVIMRDGCKCQMCRMVFPSCYPFEVTCIHPEKEQPSPEDLITLCLRCRSLYDEHPRES